MKLRRQVAKRRQALLTLMLLATGEREDLWHPGYRELKASGSSSDRKFHSQFFTSLKFLSIFVHISSSTEPITLLWVLLEISFPPVEVEYR